MGPLVAAAALALVHLAGARLVFLDRVPRPAVLSVGGGIAVAYVFVHLLPELGAEQARLSDAAEGVLPFVEHHAYLVALAGLVVFYAVEHATVRAKRSEEDAPPAATFRLALGTFAVKNVAIGYLLVHRLDDGATGLALFTLAMGLHFLVNDIGLGRNHRERYHRVGRYVLAAAPLVGVAIGEAVVVSEAAIAVLLAFVAGGVILNTLKEELPRERESRLSAFLAGAAAYAALLLAAA